MEEQGISVLVKKSEDGGALRLSGSIAITGAEELQEALRELVYGEAAPIVDVSGVEKCDAATLQLLCSAQKSAGTAGKSLEICGIPEAMRSAAAALGLTLPELGERSDPGRV